MENAIVDYSKKWFVMVAVGLGILLSTLDSSIVNIALPTITEFFNTEFPVVQWVVLGYLLTVTVLMLSIGRLADMQGKKPIYTMGFIIFTIGSILCGLSPSINALIFFRVVQAVGAAMVLALGLAIITESFPSSERGKAIGISGAIVSIGVVLGPTLGGIIINIISWRWIFFVNLPIGIIGTWLAIQFVPKFNPLGKQIFDLKGAITLCLALISLLLALTLGQRQGFTAPIVIVLFISWMIFQLLFILVELSVSQPMIDLRLFKNTLFTINLVNGLITFVCLAGTLILMPFYLQNILGYNPQQVGFLMATVPVVLAIFSPLSGLLSDKYGPRLITSIGLAFITIGYWGVSTLSLDTGPLEYILRFLPVGIGMGIFQSPNNSAIMGEAPQGRLGTISGLLAVNRTMGQTAGIAILGALWAARVFFHEGRSLIDGATTATINAQVAGMHDTFVINTVLVASAFLLSLWALVAERRR